MKLAVALLKDTKGNIDIQLPVAGDLNNPEFSVMPIVWQTLRNLVLRAVQAPFKFIAGLAAGGNEDLGTVPFAAGSDELTPEAQANLDKLADALKERPALRLEVEGVASAAADGPRSAPSVSNWNTRTPTTACSSVAATRSRATPSNSRYRRTCRHRCSKASTGPA